MDPMGEHRLLGRRHAPTRSQRAHSCRRPPPIVVLLAAAGIGLTRVDRDRGLLQRNVQSAGHNPDRGKLGRPDIGRPDIRRALLSCGRLPDGH